MDIIYIRSLQIDTVVGLYAWERKIRQYVTLDIDIACDIQHATASDDIKDTLDYKAISKRVTEFVRVSRFKLVETLIEKIAALILQEFAVTWVRLCLNKMGALSQAQAVGITLERGIRPD